MLMRVTKKTILLWAVGCSLALCCVLNPISASADSQVMQWAVAGCRASLGGTPYAEQICKAISTAMYTNSNDLTVSCKNACQYVTCTNGIIDKNACSQTCQQACISKYAR
jgi:hypothetical protein